MLTTRQASRRRWLSLVWAASTVLWSLLRTVAVRLGLHRYGVNVWVFAVLDLASAGVLAVSTLRAVFAVVDSQWRRAVVWGFITAVGFITPDIYVLLSTGHMPMATMIVVLTIVVVSATASAVGIARQIRQARRATRQATRQATPSQPTPASAPWT